MRSKLEAELATMRDEKYRYQEIAEQERRQSSDMARKLEQLESTVNGLTKPSQRPISAMSEGERRDLVFLALHGDDPEVKAKSADILLKMIDSAATEKVDARIKQERESMRSDSRLEQLRGMVSKSIMDGYGDETKADSPLRRAAEEQYKQLEDMYGADLVKKVPHFSELAYMKALEKVEGGPIRSRLEDMKRLVSRNRLGQNAEVSGQGAGSVESEASRALKAGNSDLALSAIAKALVGDRSK
jgi:hypothetical protein